jgi:hypothetical protein
MLQQSRAAFSARSRSAARVPSRSTTIASTMSFVAGAFLAAAVPIVCRMPR